MENLNNSDDELELDESETELFNEIMGQLKSGREVWLPRNSEADIIDLFKYKKYQGCIVLVDIEEKTYNAYRANPENPSEEMTLINSEPAEFERVARLLLSIIPPDASIDFL